MSERKQPHRQPKRVSLFWISTTPTVDTGRPYYLPPRNHTTPASNKESPLLMYSIIVSFRARAPHRRMNRGRVVLKAIANCFAAVKPYRLLLLPNSRVTLLSRTRPVVFRSFDAESLVSTCQNLVLKRVSSYNRHFRCCVTSETSKPEFWKRDDLLIGSTGLRDAVWEWMNALHRMHANAFMHRLPHASRLTVGNFADVDAWVEL